MAKLENRFTVALQSIAYPRDPFHHDNCRGLSPGSVDLLDRMYSALTAMTASKIDRELNSRKIDGSLFSICIEEGWVLLGACVDLGVVSLTGFLIRRDTSLRLAWRMVWRELILLCAAGWDKTGVVRMDVQEIKRLVSDIRFPVERLELLTQLGMAIHKAPAPYTYALTGIDIERLPINFDGRVIPMFVDETSSDAEDGRIVLSKNVTDKWRMVYSNTRPELRNCALIRRRKKQLIAEMEELGTDKSSLKSMLSGYSPDCVWAFYMEHRRLVYLCPVSLGLNEGLNEGAVPFDDLYSEMTEFLRTGMEMLRRAESRHTPTFSDAELPRPLLSEPSGGERRNEKSRLFKRRRK